MNNSDLQKQNVAESFELESEIRGRQSTDEMIQGSEIIWSGDCSICRKKLKHYLAFSKNGITVTVHSFAIILSKEKEEEEHEHEHDHVGYLEDLYEDYRKQKMVKVRWFHRSEEMSRSGFIIPKHELILTPDVQVVSAECINGIATVLSPKDYEKCLSIVSQDFSGGIFMCSRQIKKTKIMSFSMRKLRGYLNQTIISMLSPPNSLNQQVSSDKQEETEEKEVVQACATNVGTSSEVCRFGVGDKIEVLCEDSGIRGCWYKCKILKTTKKSLKVVYMDVEDAGGPGNLTEWIRYKVAGPDKLGLRCLGRYTMRPFNVGTLDTCYKIGSAVDVWRYDGWWEGVVTTNICGDRSFSVYFPDENISEDFKKEQLRSSKDWVDNKWVQVVLKPDDIIRVLSLALKLSNVKRAALGGGGGDGSG